MILWTNTEPPKRALGGLLALGALSGALALGTPAHADDALDPAALDLFQRGRRLIKDGDWEGGCAAIDASLRRASSVSARLNLALCQEHQGKVASAWATVERARAENRETRGEARRAELAKTAEELALRLGPRLPRLRVTSPSLAGARVTEGGRELPADTPVPLDPGSHELVLSAPDRPEVRRTVVLREGEVLAVELAFPVDAASPEAQPPPHTDPEPTQHVDPAPAPRTDPPDVAPLPVWAFVTAGVGIALGGVGIGFGVDAANTSAALIDRCGEDLVCDEDPSFDPEPDNDHKNRSLALAIGFGAAGGAGLVAGVVGLGVSLAQRPAAGPAPTSVTLAPAPGGAALVVRGRF